MKDFAKSIVCNTKTEAAKVGNYTPNYRYKGFLITNPEGYEFVVFLQDGLHVGYRGTTSKAQAEDWCDWHDPKTGKPVAKFRNSKTGNSKVGNAYTEADMKRLYELARKRNKTASEWAEFNELNRREEQASKELIKKLGKNKTGNADLSAISKHWSKETIDHILQNAHVFKKEVVEEAKRLKEAEKNKTGNDTPAEYFSKKPKVIGNEKTGAEGFFKKLSDDVKDREKKDDEDIEKVGNSTVSEYNSEIQRLTKKAEQLRRMGQGRQAMEVEKQIEKLGKELSEIGNSKTGNSYADKLPTVMDYRKALDEIIEKKRLNPDEARRKYGQFTYAQWEKELGHKIGNEASDDKFAYVMREFDEGKLKTPEGKVVTDPAQAKAIAYSESKKTENGLARARNAMNKKNPDGLRLKIQDYAGQGLSYQDIVNQLIRFGYDKSDIEAQKEYIKSLIKE